MNQQLATIEQSGAYTSAQVDLIKRTVAANVTDDELALFLEVCRLSGLNPFLRQVYAIKRTSGGESRMTIQTGIDGYRLLAARTGALAGIDDAVFNDEEREHPTWARVTVWRFVQGQRVAFTATARWAEYAAMNRDGHPVAMWAKMPYLMLGKCSEALALRKAFPAELSGVYTAEEMAQADNPPTIVNASVAASAPSPTAAPRALEPDRIGLPLRNAQVLDLMVSLQRFSDADRRREMASVIEAIEAAGQQVTLATVKAELKARIEDLNAMSADAEVDAAPADLSDLPVGVRGN